MKNKAGDNGLILTRIVNLYYKYLNFENVFKMSLILSYKCS